MDYVAACYIETPLGGAKPPGTSAADLIAAGLTQETIKLMIVSGSIVAAEEKPKHHPAVVKEEQETTKPAVSKEKWSFDPVSLLNLTVEQLNAKIAEHADGEEIPEIETKEEAIAFLSQDFKS